MWRRQGYRPVRSERSLYRSRTEQVGRHGERGAHRNRQGLHWTARWSGRSRLIAQHLRVIEEQNRASLIRRNAEGFFVDFEVFGPLPIEPRIGADAPGAAFVFIFSEQGDKSKALMIQILLPFVSVTQQFNTTTSMGRLTLN